MFHTHTHVTWLPCDCRVCQWWREQKELGQLLWREPNLSPLTFHPGCRQISPPCREGHFCWCPAFFFASSPWHDLGNTAPWSRSSSHSALEYSGSNYKVLIKAWTCLCSHQRRFGCKGRWEVNYCYFFLNYCCRCFENCSKESEYHSWVITLSFSCIFFIYVYTHTLTHTLAHIVLL